MSEKGFKVYLDWIVDPNLDRSNVTKESAELIRSRMKSSKSLLLATSPNAATSKWMPWELGYVDGHTNKCAITPVYDDSYGNPEVYQGFEYLKLYPYVKKDDFGKIQVAESSFSYVELNRFLEGEAPFLRSTRL